MGATISRTVRLEWADTDASGMWHHSTVWRWLERLEADLHRGLGLTGLAFPAAPRRSVRAEFTRRVVFDDEVTCTLEVQRVGRTSVTYTFTAVVGGETAATAELTCVLVDEDGRPRAWPDHARELLLG